MTYTCMQTASVLCSRCQRLQVDAPPAKNALRAYSQIQLSEFAEPLSQLRVSGYASRCDHVLVIRPAALRAFRRLGLDADIRTVASHLEVESAWIEDAISAFRALSERPGIALFAFQTFSRREYWRTCLSLGFRRCIDDELAALDLPHRREVDAIVRQLESQFDGVLFQGGR